MKRYNERPSQLMESELTSNSNGKNKIDFDEFDVEKYFLYWTILPGFTIKRSSLSLNLLIVLGSILIQCFAFVKYLILLIVGSDEFWIYWLGDITFNFGYAKDYCDLCFMIWAASTISAQLIFINSYLNNNLSWLKIFRLIGQRPPRKFVSNFERSVFLSIYPKVVIICKIGIYLLITTATGIVLSSLIYLQKGLIYLITIGFVYGLISLANCYITTVFVGLVSFIFSLVCHQYKLWVKLMDDYVHNYLIKRLDRSLPRSSHLKLYRFIIKEYGFFHNDLLHATKFWNRTISGLFLGCSASSVLVIYEYFFVDLDLVTTIAITIFGLCTFINGCLINVLAPANLLHNFQRLIYPFHKLLTLDLPPGIKLGLIVVLDDIKANQCFTCYRMFQYNYSLILWLLLELSTFLLLLISSKNGLANSVT
ncbi:uncharacterized protein LOC128386011 [Panonychus citri]|uniref:uncharacterized protein LOC128386011 n=1 Tax=Panonychus citri TaxID=50023 RepID=UPI002306E552|nr:uncharacterized protein LOC128386011 [Panonychus citri]